MAYYIFVVALLSCLPIYDTTLLWRINSNPPAYLFATVHVPYTDIWPTLSDTVKSAFKNSTHFYPEYDLTNFFSAIKLRMCVNNKKLPIGIPTPSPEMLRQQQAQTPILDIHLTLEARRLVKNVEALEDLDIYCEFTKFQVETLTKNYTLHMDKPELLDQKAIEEIKRTYNCDLNSPEELYTPTTAHTDDKALLAFKQHLEEIVGRRDTRMAQKINDLLKEKSANKRFFFAVGFAHLMSPTGIVAKLRKDYSHSVSRLCTDSHEYRASLKCEKPSWCDRIAGL
ncbi:unnamed protein product [Adineta steineri]|uniref:Metalloprotease TIKI homolog n=1 Tax=Adineta steineri TaxID=433720 RepID=A0A818N3Q4_9BILA|nr:unnamed protein product [Adineta steineri]CAF3599093.1 unnamed protein product [Adineta steineri]